MKTSIILGIICLIHTPLAFSEEIPVVPQAPQNANKMESLDINKKTIRSDKKMIREDRRKMRKDIKSFGKESTQVESDRSQLRADQEKLKQDKKKAFIEQGEHRHRMHRHASLAK